MVANLYTFGCTLGRVVDGDTIDLDVDLGFRVSVRIRVRLIHSDGGYFDAPEVRGPDKAEGNLWRDAAVSWFAQAPKGYPLYVTTTKRGRGKFGRWLGSIFSVLAGDVGDGVRREYLTDYLQSGVWRVSEATIEREDDE